AGSMLVVAGLVVSLLLGLRLARALTSQEDLRARYRAASVEAAGTPRAEALVAGIAAARDASARCAQDLPTPKEAEEALARVQGRSALVPGLTLAIEGLPGGSPSVRRYRLTARGDFGTLLAGLGAVVERTHPTFALDNVTIAAEGDDPRQLALLGADLTVYVAAAAAPSDTAHPLTGQE
ncbi:MAG TPA: hypothetical protein VM283_07280, partial [Armatimonadota bacterium]|nr:hypothetical protein [Armatimonadota bacterium]